ncbi:MAG TPA: hypothetical protein VL527_01560 [Dongiaceae bacterium]|nr:hypothetical protein [Dongiaceae bacterium]
MKVEEAFGVSIEDSDAERMTTPRDIIEFVMRKVGNAGPAQCQTQRAFYRVRVGLIRYGGFQRREIRSEVATAKLFPLTRRQELLDKILVEVGIAERPEMVRPWWLFGFGVVAVVGMAGVVSGSLARISPGPSFILNLLAAAPAAFALFAAGLTGWLFALMTRPLRYEFGPALADIGGLARWLVAHGADRLGGPPGQWSSEQIAAKVREIVIEQLGCEKKYREDAHFVKELGLS